MRKLLTILFLLLAAITYSQTNATFNNLDVRNKSTFRGYHYIYDSTFFKPTGSNIPWWDITDTLGFVLSVSNPNESQLVKVRLSTLLDSLGIVGSVDSFYVAYGCYGNIDTWLYNSDTIYIDTCFAVDSVSYADTSGYAPQYWTFVDAAIDTLKNNVATAGVVAIKGNLELETTNAAATNGIIKQNGVNLMHTYHEKGDNNLFIGQGAGNFTLDSSFNIGIGKNALKDITEGFYNVAIGSGAAEHTTTATWNIAIGVNALHNATTSEDNFAIGKESLYNITTASGHDNYAIGVQSQYSGTTANFNISYGFSALRNNSTGDDNVALGYQAMLGNPTTSAPSNCIGIGGYSLYNVTTTVFRDIAIGYQALNQLTNGDDNIAIGYKSGYGTTTGGQNVFIGTNACTTNVAGSGTVAVGYQAMYYGNSTASATTTYNTAIGYEAIKGSSTAANNTGQYNTATGYQALDGMTSGSFNTVYGYNAGGGITTGDSNILIGTSAGAQLTTESDRLYIDNTNTTTPLIYGNFRTDALTFNGDITYGDTFWDDLSTPATAAKIGANSKPTFDYDTLALLWDNTPVDTTTSYIVLNYQLPHRWKAGSDLYLHVHYLQHTAADTCEWFKATYKWTDMGETRAGAYTTTKTDNQTVYAYTANTLHQLASFPLISGAGHTESSILQIVLYCYSDANLYSLDTDIHFEIDKPGSDAQFP